MPKNSKFSKSTKAKRPSRRQNRSAPTHQGRTPGQVALYHVPLFPAVARQHGQLYYDRSMPLTTGATGNVTYLVFSANGMYDPDIIGTGHQPMGFDQMMSLYNHYTVVRSSITFTFVIDSPAGLPIRAAVGIFPSSAPSSNPLVFMENGLLVSHAYPGAVSANQAAAPSLTLNCDVARTFGRKSEKDVIYTTELSGDASNNPAEQTYFIFGAWQIYIDGATSTTLKVDVLMSYDAVYWEPKKEAIS